MIADHKARPGAAYLNICSARTGPWWHVASRCQEDHRASWGGLQGNCRTRLFCAMGEHRLTGPGSPLPKSGMCFCVAWKEFSTPLSFHGREQLSHSTCQERTGDKARTTTRCNIALPIAKRGRIHWVHLTGETRCPQPQGCPQTLPLGQELCSMLWTAKVSTSSKRSEINSQDSNPLRPSQPLWLRSTTARLPCA